MSTLTLLPGSAGALDGWHAPDRETGIPPSRAEATVHDAPDLQEAALREAVVRMADGDEDGLRRLYDETIGRVYGLALRIVRLPAAAEDVCAEVYHQAWRGAARFDAARGNVPTWLLTMTRSRAIDHLRRRDRAQLHPEPGMLRDTSDEDRADDPANLLSAFQTGTRLHASLSSLPAVQRQLIALAFFQGLSHQEIADHTGMPLGTVKSHLRKAMERLKSDLAEPATDAGGKSS